MRKTIVLGCLAVCVQSVTAQVEQADSLTDQHLSEVVVKGDKPLVQTQNGAMLVDLPAIVKDKPVTNILESLGYLPGVVNNNGMIGLAGASNVTIILNGEPTQMPVSNLYQLLYMTPVDRLKHVEIMYAAPAKYHVNGAVINVVLKTPSPLDGLQGQVRIGGNWAHYGSYGGTLSSTYATKNWTFDLNYSLSHTRNWSHQMIYSNHLHNGFRNWIEEDSRKISRNLSHLVYASAGYRFSEKSHLLLSYNGQLTADVHHRALTDGTWGQYTNRLQYPSPIGFHQVAMKYVTPFGLSVGGDYMCYSEERTQSLYGQTADEAQTVSDNSQQIHRYHAFVDQEHDIKGWQLSYGVEYQHMDDKGSQHYERPALPGFESTLREDVADAYVGLQHSFKSGLSFNASVKGEYYRNKYEHNWNFIPSLSMAYNAHPRHMFQFNLMTQRVYPKYWELHGGTNYLNEYSMVLGNTALQPSLDYSGQLSYIFRQKYVATLYFHYGDKAMTQLPYQSPDELKLIFQTINMNYKRVVGLNLQVPVQVGQLWNATFSGNLFNQREKADRFHQISFDHSKWIVYGAWKNTLKFTPQSPFSFTVDVFGITPAMQGIADLSRLWRVDVGAKWLLGKKRNCEFNVRADDIFNRWSPTMTIHHAGQDYRMKVKDMSRNVKLTFIWHFNGFKPKDTTVDTSRFGMDQ